MKIESIDDLIFWLRTEYVNDGIYGEPNSAYLKSEEKAKELKENMSSGWIDISDRLPDEYKRVLVYGTSMHYTEICLYVKKYGWVVNCGIYLYETLLDITHWKEIPSNWKEIPSIKKG